MQIAKTNTSSVSMLSLIDTSRATLSINRLIMIADMCIG